MPLPEFRDVNSGKCSQCNQDQVPIAYMGTVKSDEGNYITTSKLCLNCSQSRFPFRINFDLDAENVNNDVSAAGPEWESTFTVVVRKLATISLIDLPRK
jgi:hypothetical protein